MRTEEFRIPGIERLAPRRCPRCGADAAVHAKLTRAIHDWEVTFVDCLRLRCCGRTWTSAPRGLTPRSRYSDRVEALARVLASCGVSYRRSAALMRRLGVTVTAQTLQAWCRDIERVVKADARLSSSPDDALAVVIRPGLWVAFRTRSPRRLASLLKESFEPAMPVALSA